MEKRDKTTVRKRGNRIDIKCSSGDGKAIAEHLRKGGSLRDLFGCQPRQEKP